MPLTCGIFKSTGGECPGSFFTVMEPVSWDFVPLVNRPWFSWKRGRSFRSLRLPPICLSFRRPSRWDFPHVPSRERRDWAWLLRRPTDSRLAKERGVGWLRRRCFWFRSSSFMRSERANGGLRGPEPIQFSLIPSCKLLGGKPSSSSTSR